MTKCVEIGEVKVVVALLLILGGGCDWINGERERRIKEQEAAREMLRGQEALQESRDALDKYLAGKQDLLDAGLVSVKGSLKSVREDVASLAAVSKEMADMRDAKGRELPFESKMLRLTRDDKVNALAVKYLATDFSILEADFVENVRAAREEERRYAAAVRRIDELYEQNVQDAEKWSKMSATQRDEEIARLRKEIASLERERDGMMKKGRVLSRGELSGSRQQARERREKILVYERELADLDRQIGIKRDQVDYLRNPNTHQQVERRAVHEALFAQDRANQHRRRALQDVDSTMRPKKTLLEVISEYESKTIGALKQKMASELEKWQKEESSLVARLQTTKEWRLSVPLSDESELKRIRSSAVRQ